MMLQKSEIAEPNKDARYEVYSLPFSKSFKLTRPHDEACNSNSCVAL